MDKEKTTLFYYAENAKELRKIIDGQLVTFGGISDFDKDDFYSIGNEVFTSALNSYVDGKGVPFRAYLTLCLKNKIKQEMTKRNTAKRKAELTSIDEFEDFDVRADGNLEEEILSDESAREYYNSLTDLGRKIVSLRMANVSDVEIRERLGITTRKLDSEIKRMKRMIKTKTKTERTNSARRTARPINEGEELNMSIAPDYRDDYLSLALLKDKIEAGELLLSHPNQRNDWQWSPIDISTLICTNLHGFRINPIIVCEESLEDGTILNWIIDGKQRVTPMLNFAYPEDPSKPFKISPKTEYTEIPSADDPGCFDYKLYMKSKGVTIRFKAYILEVTDMEVSPATKVRRYLYGARESFISRFDPDTQGFIRGVIFGDKSEIDEDLLEEFNNNSTGHILAVSGLHMGFLYGLLRFLTARRRTLPVSILITAVILLYGEMTMWSPATVRACIVMTISLCASHLRRCSDLLTSVIRLPSRKPCRNRCPQIPCRGRSDG